MAKYIGAIDQGTTSTRFILFDERGAITTLAPSSTPEPRQASEAIDSFCRQRGWECSG